jgi:hypothetical protein
MRSFRRNPGLARTSSNCRRAPCGSVGAMGTASSIHLVFSDVQMYETYLQHVGTCSSLPARSIVGAGLDRAKRSKKEET